MTAQIACKLLEREFFARFAIGAFPTRSASREYETRGVVASLAKQSGKGLHAPLFVRGIAIIIQHGKVLLGNSDRSGGTRRVFKHEQVTENGSGGLREDLLAVGRLNVGGTAERLFHAVVVVVAERRPAQRLKFNRAK